MSAAWWRRPAARALLLQGALLLGAVALVALLVTTALDNLARQGIATGLGFWDDQAGFGIASSTVAYDESMSYGRAFLVGLLNTLLVSALGIATATMLGFGVGVMRGSPHPLVRGWGTAYVEVVRNIPLLLQIFFWYFAVLGALPSPRESLELGPVLLNNRGLSLPWPSWQGGFHWQVPALGRFNVAGGATVVPEFLALWTALSIYTGAFIAEIVRAGLNAIARGQREAARALGLRRRQALKLVVLPQAMRLIVPPLTNQYLNLTKNSSLAVAIGYPDLVNVFAGTVLNQTGQAIEVLTITMAVYLAISLTIAAGMQLYERRRPWAGAAA